jgi:chaperonin cofactor prefoldin
LRRAQKNIEREAAAQQVQDLTKELADCKKQLVDSEASKAQLENKLSEPKEVLSGVQHRLNEDIRLGTSAGSKTAVKKL